MPTAVGSHKSSLKCFFLNILPLLTIRIAQANLLTNPSFEDNVFPVGTNLQVPSSTGVLGWTEVNGGYVELWSTGFIPNVDAYNGNNFLELDHVRNVYNGVYQDVTTEAGKAYTLSFYMRPRTPDYAHLARETVVVEWNNVTTNTGGYNVQTTNWTRIEITVIGTGGSDRLTLRESEAGEASDGKGPFIDMVELILKPLSGGGGGDPHFRTWTGLRYDYHGECDLVFLQNPTFNHGEGLHIHIRTVRNGYYSYIERAAIQIGHDVLEFAGITEWYKNGVKASKQPNQSFGTYKLRVHGQAVSVRIDEKRKLKIDFNHRRNGFLYLAVDGKDTDIFKGSLGMIGQWGSGQMVDRDGVTVLTDPNDMARQWQVRDTDPILFLEQSGPQYPTSCRPPKKFLGERIGSSIMRRRAENVCQRRSQEELAECVFDVMATRNLGAAAF